MYSVLDRGIFIAGLCLIVMPMFVKRLSWLTAILGNGVFAAMAKVTYSVYLIHVVIIFVFIGS